MVNFVNFSLYENRDKIRYFQKIIM